MAIYRTSSGLIITPDGLGTSSNCCCGYCCIDGQCINLDPSVGKTCSACTAAGGVCHLSQTITCATQSDCECSQGSGSGGTGGSYCDESGFGAGLL